MEHFAGDAKKVRTDTCYDGNDPTACSRPYTVLATGEPTDKGKTMAEEKKQGGADLLDSEVKKLQDEQGAAPSKHMPGHAFHVRHGANMLDVGWLRPMYYTSTDESPDEAIVRETLHVRNEVGIYESSTLGKFEVSGPDAATFLNRIYSNSIENLKVGKTRYCLEADESGALIDDGVCAHIAENHYLSHTTSMGAAKITEWFDRWLAEWSDLNVQIINVSEQWALIVVCGPKVRDVMQVVDSDIDFSNEAFPPMAYREGTFAGFPARLLRVSFTGELAYEINVAATNGEAVMNTIYEAGQASNIIPFGIGALNYLRMEKGFMLPGFDTDADTSPVDLGWGEALARKQGDFIGKDAMALPPNKGDGRLKQVKLSASNPGDSIVQGGQIVASLNSEESLGRVTSACMSPTLNKSIGIGLIKDGFDRIGDEVYVVSDDSTAPVVISNEAPYDPQGERVRK